MARVEWRLPRRTLLFDDTVTSAQTRAVMGILNVTPDSFSDGGRFLKTSLAVAHAQQMIEDGADIIDVGGESSRPGADPVSAEVELARVVPAIKAIRSQSDVLISIDTVKSDVARAALEAGADIVNDISACRADPRMVEVVKAYQAGLVLMHMRGTPKNMQLGDLSTDCVVTDVMDFFRERIQTMCGLGLEMNQLCVDPGIGFGKTVAQNFSLCRSLRTMGELGRPILFGISRKSCLGALINRPAEERDAASLTSDIWALQQGASVLRVHNVRQTTDAVCVLDQLSNGEESRG